MNKLQLDNRGLYFLNKIKSAFAALAIRRNCFLAFQMARTELHPYKIVNIGFF